MRPTVFHPRFFISSERFAEFIGGLDLSGKHVVDIGPDPASSRSPRPAPAPRSVTATDINPNAALSAVENAHANGLGDRVTALCTNLLSALAPRPLFDVILSSPPKHAGEPRNLADRGWHAGPQYRDIAALFDQARERLNPGGRLYVMVSSDSDLDLFGKLIDRAGFRARMVYEHSLVIESLIIYEMLPDLASSVACSRASRAAQAPCPPAFPDRNLPGTTTADRRRRGNETGLIREIRP